MLRLRSSGYAKGIGICLLVGSLALVVGSSAAYWFMLHLPANPSSVACPAISVENTILAGDLRRHVENLAQRIGARSAEHAEALDGAAQYIEQELQRLGWKSERQYVATNSQFFNIATSSPSRRPGEPILVVGAHYDTVDASPGADDNASGVATLLEVAHLLGPAASQSVRLIAFTNEEAPLGRTELRGSGVAARHAREMGDPIIGMLALESIGYFSDVPGSQKHPWPLAWFFPSTANYLAFVANPSSRALLHRISADFKNTSPLPIEAVAIPPTFVRHIRRSDHAPYWDNGYPALLVTGTAEFRNPHYHRPSDLPATLDYDRLAQATLGIAAAVKCVTQNPNDQPR